MYPQFYPNLLLNIIKNSFLLIKYYASRGIYLSYTNETLQQIIRNFELKANISEYSHKSNL